MYRTPKSRPLTDQERQLLDRMPPWFRTLRKTFNPHSDEDLFRLVDYFTDR